MQKPSLQPNNDFNWIQEFTPAEEPVLTPCEDGPRKSKVYSVAETHLSGKERDYVNECIDSNWISSKGPFVRRFEDAFAREAGCEFAVTCSSGTAALHLVLAALGVGSGDEVIIPAFTMIATANAAHYVGADIKLVDAEPNYFNIDADLVEAAITPRTKAIIAVHTYGHPAQMQRLQAIAQERKLYLIEDAAEAHGAEISGKRVGSFGHAGAFSFYANKIITTGEGGMVTTNDRKFADHVRRLSHHAFHPERHFWHEYVGFNYRMTNLQAAIGLAQTERLTEIVEARRRVWGWYGDRLKSVPGLQLPAEAPDCKNVFWMYAVRTGSAFGCEAHALRMRLAQRGIETRAFFAPMHLQPIYAARFHGQRFPVAEELCRTGLYLPTHENLSKTDVDWIGQQIEDVHRKVNR